MDTITRTIVDLTRDLIARPSVTPEDAGCQGLMADYLKPLGFDVVAMPFADVSNLWATHGSGQPMLMLAGHTDVVPPGPSEQWTSPPFEPEIRDGMLYGRGSADMKGSLAAMLTAAETFVAGNPDHIGTLAFLITSDEEGDAVNGTCKVVEHLRDTGVHPEYCVVGEPSSTRTVGDVVRIGRRGSLNGRLTLRGVQGHVAYPDQADNPIHAAGNVIRTLTGTHWDEGNDAFPPTSFQISNIRGGTGATNVIPGEVVLDFNFRFSTEQTSQGLKQRVTELLDALNVDHQIDWRLSGEPFLTPQGALIDAVTSSVRAVQSFEPERSTGGGTSDGRFIATLGTQTVELGPVNATIHSVNECTPVSELAPLHQMYLGIIRRLLPTG